MTIMQQLYDDVLRIVYHMRCMIIYPNSYLNIEANRQRGSRRIFHCQFQRMPYDFTGWRERERETDVYM